MKGSEGPELRSVGNSSGSALSAKRVLDQCRSMNCDPIVDLIDGWKLHTNSAETVTCVARVLRSMEASAFSTICDSRLQAAVLPRGMIWAYFPIYRRRWIVRQLPYPIDPGVKALLVVGEDSVASQPRRTTMAELAHHFGHALCYLRSPGWVHGCPDANRAAKRGGLSQFLRTPREIYGGRKRDFYCDLSESALRRKLQRLEELNRA